jgi:hypothetical protein
MRDIRRQKIVERGQIVAIDDILVPATRDRRVLVLGRGRASGSGARRGGGCLSSQERFAAAKSNGKGKADKNAEGANTTHGASRLLCILGVNSRHLADRINRMR